MQLRNFHMFRKIHCYPSEMHFLKIIIIFKEKGKQNSWKQMPLVCLLCNEIQYQQPLRVQKADLCFCEVSISNYKGLPLWSSGERAVRHL